MNPRLRRMLVLVAFGFGAVSMAQAQVGKPVAVIDPNLATEEELRALPHLTPALVASLVQARPFLRMQDFDAFLGATLDPEQRHALYGKLFVAIDLNSASRDEILLVPGVGERMAHEFEEYRPYKSLSEFHREIGKYVDDDEVTRLAQYVFVPIDLNTGSDEDILSIPGVGKRMLHEFKEYRPYSSMEQFRREIGKYVSKEEVARLERYVSISTTTAGRK